MKKSLVKSIALAPFVISSVMGGGFIGAEYGYTALNRAKFEVVSGDERAVVKSSKSSLNLNLKAGYIFNSDSEFSAFRIYAGYANSSKLKAKRIEKEGAGTYEFSFKAKTKNFTLNADWIPKINDNFKFALGGYSGISHMKYDFKDPNPNGDSLKLNSRGILFGIRVATIVEVDKNHQIEFGIKAQNTRYKTSEVYLQSEQTSYAIKPSQRGAEIYIGYNYKF